MSRLLKSKQAIARDQNVSRQTVHSWMSGPRWNLGHRFPIDGEKIDAWRAATMFPSSASSFSIPSDDNYTVTRRRVDLQYKAEQTMLLRQKRALLDNKYIERELHDRAMVGLVSEFRRRIQEWIEALPPIFAQQSELQIRRLFTDAYDRLFEKLSAMVELPLADEQEVQQLKNQTKSRAAHHKHHAH
ncbi:MAG: hypothetical protein AABZ47_18880 [Planctomycetota bacterium]